MRVFFWFSTILILSLALSLAAGTRALAANTNQDFSLLNTTPWNILSFQIRPSGGGYNWSGNFFSSGGLSSGDTTTIEVTAPVGCYHDIQVTWDGNVNREWDNMNLCKIDALAVWYNSVTRTFEETDTDN